MRLVLITKEAYTVFEGRESVAIFLRADGTCLDAEEVEELRTAEYAPLEPSKA